jgi:hypothetical protein
VDDHAERLLGEVLLLGCWWWRVLMMWRRRDDLDLLNLVVHMIRLVKYARQLVGCRLADFWPSCLWWPLFQGNPWWSVRSLCHERGSRTFMAVELGLCLFLWCWCHGPIVWDTLNDELCLRWGWIGDGVDLLLVVLWPAGFGLHRPDPCSAGLRSVLRFPLRLYLALM